MAWMCSKCNVEVEEVDDIQIFFKDLSLPEATVSAARSAAWNISTTTSSSISSPPPSRCSRANNNYKG